jgi:hypothetical protein
VFPGRSAEKKRKQTEADRKVYDAWKMRAHMEFSRRNIWKGAAETRKKEENIATCRPIVK